MEKDTDPPATLHNMAMQDATPKSRHCSSESTSSLTTSSTVSIDKERLVSLIKHIVRLSGKQRKQVAEIESLRLTLAELRRDYERMKSQLLRQHESAHHQAQNSSTGLSGFNKPEDGEESKPYVPEKSVPAARLRHHVRKTAVSCGKPVCEQVSTNPAPLHSLPGQKCPPVCPLPTSPPGVCQPGDEEGPGEFPPEEDGSVEHIRHRLMEDIATRRRRCVQEAQRSSGTSPPPSSPQSMCSKASDESCSTLSSWPSQSDIVAQHSTIQPPEDNASASTPKGHVKLVSGASAPPNSSQSPLSMSNETDGWSCSPLVVTAENARSSVDPYKLTEDWLFTPLNERDVEIETEILKRFLKRAEMERVARKSGDEVKANEEREMKRREREKLFELLRERQKQNRKIQEKLWDQMEKEEEKKLFEEKVMEENKFEKRRAKSQADRQDSECREQEKKPIKRRRMKKKDQERQHPARAERKQCWLPTDQHRSATMATHKLKNKDRHQTGKGTVEEETTQRATGQPLKHTQRKSPGVDMDVREAFLAGGQTKTPGRQDPGTRHGRPRTERNFISRCATIAAYVVEFVANGGICKMIKSFWSFMCPCMCCYMHY